MQMVYDNKRGATDMQSINQFRRKAIILGITVPMLCLSSCATEPAPPAPIRVDTTGVKSVPDLISAIKKAAGPLLPSSVTMNDFFQSIAESFVESAHAAADAGYPIPKWVLDALPARKVAAPIFVVLVIFGIKFLVPLSVIAETVLYSIAAMTAFIWLAIGSDKEKAERDKKTKKL